MNDDELLRYSRQILLPEIDVEGQEKLADGTVLVVGLGGLGSPVAIYLAAAGVGHLVLADFDTVDISNLQRQIAHTEARLGMTKVESASETIRQINSAVKITPILERVDEAAMARLIGSVDVVVDCTDNFGIRFALNRACVRYKVPLVSGAAIRLEGQVSVFDPRRDDSPCYSCLYADLSDEDMSCARNGVLASLVGIIGSVQATETIKLLADFGTPLVGRLLVLDVKTMHWRELKLNRDPNCAVCGLAGDQKDQG